MEVEISQGLTGLWKQAVHKYLDIYRIVHFSSVQSLSHVWLFVSPWKGWFPSWFSSDQFSCSVVSNSLQPHWLQHTRLPCPSPTPRACSNSCPSSQWCHPTISTSVIPFSSSLQSFPASGSFPMSQFFTSGDQSIGVLASASVLSVNTQDGLVGSPCCLRDAQESSPTPPFKSVNSSMLSFLYGQTLTSIYDYWKKP